MPNIIINNYNQDPSPDKKIIRVACYIRVSTEEQRVHGFSLDAQRAKLLEYAAAHNFRIIGWYEDEGVSGRKLIKNRPALQRMLNDARIGMFDRILFIKLDRFFRSVAEYHECMKLIEPVVWTATEEKYDLATASGRAFVNMKLTIAELEADQTGERIRIVNDYKIKNGQAIIGSQSQGIAFTVQKDEQGIKRVVPDPETKDLVMDYINHYLQFKNMNQAHLYVNQKYNTEISYNRLKRVLSDTRLYGYYKGNPNYCASYIDKETFDKIQEILKSNYVYSTTKRTYIFKGLITCPVCGNKKAGHSTRSQNSYTVKDGTVKYGKAYFFKGYHCYNSFTNRTCTHRHFTNEAALEKALLNNFDQLVSEYIKLSHIEDAIESDNINDDEIKALNEQLRKLNHMYISGYITDEEYDQASKEIKEELEQVISSCKPKPERNLTRYESLLESDWKVIYKALSDENKQIFWHKYIKEILLDSNGQLAKVIFF